MTKTLTAALVLGAATAALAQAPAAVKTPKIAVIDMARISAESKLGKAYAAQLDALRKQIDEEGTKKQQSLDKLDADIKALQDDLEKQASVLSPEAAEKKKQDIVKKTRERQAFVEDGQADLNKMRESAQQKAQSLNQEFQTRAKPQIEAVAKEKGLDILLDSQAALTLSPEFDISKDVIARLDQTEPGTGVGAAAATAPKPAQAPAAKPATPAAKPPVAKPTPKP